jgi:predicted acetyltransferase
MLKGYEIREPREEERSALFDVFRACFPGAVIFDDVEKMGRPLSDYIYGYEPLVMLVDGRIVANVSVIRREIYLEGKIVPIGGIGSVVTHPDYRRRSYAKILMQEWLRNMQEENIYISVLLTEIPWIYESLGWKIVPQGYLVVELSGQKAAKVDSNISVTKDISDVRPSIISLYDESAPSLAGAIRRDKRYWDEYYFWFNDNYGGVGDQYLLYTENSKLLGYARLHDEETQTLIGEVIVENWNSEVLKKLLTSAMKVASDTNHQKLVLGLQGNHPLRKEIVEMGLKPSEERPEGIREFCMINVLERLPEGGKHLKRLHWCYPDKF